jgi:hypothetical protein
MSFSALQNVPISINLLQQCNTTGWSFDTDGISADHESCNAGNIPLTNYPVTANQPYQISYIVVSISGGNVQPQTPGGNGIARTTPGLYVETITPTSNGFLSFYSNATCKIQGFNIKPISSNPGTTIVYSATNSHKREMAIWSDMRTFYPDFGWSLYTRTILANNGAMWVADNGQSNGTANNFFGTQFQSSIKLVEAKNPTIVKDFEALAYQANQLLVTTIDGIQTSLGQISTLIDTDFIKTNLSSGGLSVTGYQNDGVYSASFLGDENDQNIVNGSGMRGSYIIIELITNDGSAPLTLFSVSVRSKVVSLGSRPL